MKNILLLSALLMFGILLFGCTGQGAAQQQNSTQPQNLTQTVTPAAQFGDNVTVDYILTVDGQVLDTSILDVAKSAGIYDTNRDYQPLTFTLLTDQGMIPGFVNNIVGMKVGESKKFTVAPADGYGPVNQSKIINLPRYYNISRFQDVPMSDFVQNNITVTAGETLPSAVGNLSIYNYTNDTVTLMYSMDIGQKFMQSGLPMEVVNFTKDTLFFRLDALENNTYSVTNQVTGDVNQATVIHADNETVTLDENSPLAGKTLNFEVTLKALSH